MSGVLILGAGGHAKVIADILFCQGTVVQGFLDDDPELWGRTRLGLPVLGAINQCFKYEPDGLIIGIGNNLVRQRIAELLTPQALSLWCNAIHPQATIAGSVQMGRGIVVGAKAVINPDSILGHHVVINTAATVDHDCTINDFAHVAPGVNLGGEVFVGKGAFLGIGSSLIPGIRIGDWAKIGAGSVVVRDLPSGSVAFGVPAKPRATTS